MDRASLEKIYHLNRAISDRELDQKASEMKLDIPLPYLQFLRLSNGLYSGEELVLLEIEEIEVRNNDYEVQEYLPGYVMVGDNSGGIALVMNSDEDFVYEVDMGSMDVESMKKSADSLQQLLIDFKGKTLDYREN
ncbi:SMI1/KNR4 family protein [Vibrio rotiferianus]|uniref:SMI1/KNR4 family protein n=1 Tax=Vibrio rotiferianus TaxID=190895 RepID=UPI0006ACCF86|nr:SMI1/KNR4 family protein [Vibrio rotiferianus]PIB11561.1 putative Cell wall assembly and cell proliferation coordinating protein, KNR4-like [Vibrio rotiferianus CAIM 577 = LMG 21460]